MKYCTKCLYPDTKPLLEFDKNGVCSACINSEKKETIDWLQKEKDFKEILKKYKSKDNRNYDCIIPVSGGKDSTFQAYTMKERFGLNPLVVNLHPLDQTDIGRKNLENLKKLGVDCIEFTPNPTVYSKLAKFGLIELGDFQWPEHIGIFTIPVQIAVKFKIPLIIWGETSEEYGVATEKHHVTYFLDKIKPEDMTQHGFKTEELIPYIYPSNEEIKKVGIMGIFLGSYIKWDIFKQLEIVKELGFLENEEIKEGTYDKWENIDVYFTVFHDYFKFLKYGFGRATDHASIEIRHGRLTRNEGIELVKKYEGKIPKKYLEKFLDAANISENEFCAICDKFTNKEIFLKNPDGSIKKDDENNIMLKNPVV